MELTVTWGCWWSWRIWRPDLQCTGTSAWGHNLVWTLLCSAPRMPHSAAQTDCADRDLMGHCQGASEEEKMDIFVHIKQMTLHFYIHLSIETIQRTWTASAQKYLVSLINWIHKNIKWMHVSYLVNGIWHKPHLYDLSTLICSVRHS